MKSTSAVKNSSKNRYVDDDEDLKSLIGQNKQQQQYNNNNGYSDDTTSQKQVPTCITSLHGMIRYQLHNCCFFYPITCTIISILVVGIGMWLLLGSIINPYQQFGLLDGHDHSDIQSKYDLKIQEIDHFCLGGSKYRDDTSMCTCENPLDPYARVEYTSWVLAYKTNRLKIDQQYIEKKKNPDVAFLGGSIGKFFVNEREIFFSFEMFC
jgi:hypothetical protein